MPCWVEGRHVGFGHPTSPRSHATFSFTSLFALGAGGVAVRFLVSCAGLDHRYNNDLQMIIYDKHKKKPDGS